MLGAVAIADLVLGAAAIADLVLADGDPVADLSLVGRPDEVFMAIIKGGQVAKGCLQPAV